MCPPPRPGGPNSFNFMQFWGNFGKIICWRPRGVGAPPRRNPGSATAQFQIISRLKPGTDPGFSPGGEKVQGSRANFFLKKNAKTLQFFKTKLSPLGNVP